MEEEKKIKKWPKEYYGSKQDCKNMSLRRCTPAKARRMGVLGWVKSK